MSWDKVGGCDDTALQPYLHDKLEFMQVLGKAGEPFRQFMVARPRREDLVMFVRLSSQADRIAATSAHDLVDSGLTREQAIFDQNHYFHGQPVSAPNLCRFSI